MGKPQVRVVLIKPLGWLRGCDQAARHSNPLFPLSLLHSLFLSLSVCQINIVLTFHTATWQGSLYQYKLPTFSTLSCMCCEHLCLWEYYSGNYEQVTFFSCRRKHFIIFHVPLHILLIDRFSNFLFFIH